MYLSNAVDGLYFMMAIGWLVLLFFVGRHVWRNGLPKKEDREPGDW
jgi:ABC-type uncharacterized transport system permease subunit